VSEVIDATALVVTAAGLLAALGVAVVAGLRAAVPVLLDFLLAAGLLRLAVGLEWDRILTTALLVAIRHIVSAGIAATAAPRTAVSRGASDGAPDP
jgi:hypothetical protein